MPTRRDFLVAGTGLCLASGTALAFGPKDFWERKPYTDWNVKEIDRLLAHSPWAKDAAVRLNSGLTVDGIRGAGKHYAVPADETAPSSALVRWESSKVMRKALEIGANEGPNEDEVREFFILRVLLEKPRFDGFFKSTDPFLNWRAARGMEERTRLRTKSGTALRLIKIRNNSEGTEAPIYYFARTARITTDDRHLHFETQAGQLEVRARFPLKDMLYHGDLDL